MVNSKRNRSLILPTPVLAVAVALLVNSVTPESADAGELIFDAEFSNQPDWQNTTANERLPYPEADGREGKAPGGFDAFFTSEKWHQSGVSASRSDGVVSNQPVAQISDFQARREGGKSFVIFDESYGSKGEWGADAQLAKDLPENYQELWVEFYIKFQEDWIWMDVESGKGQSIMKLFRARHVPDNYTEKTRFDFFGKDGRAKSPVYMLDLKSWSGDGFSRARLTPFIRGYTPQHLIGKDDNYFLKDYEEETSIKQGGRRSLSFADVFQNGDWVKINVRIKMDSYPGAGDGVEEVWINDVLEKRRDDIPFRRAGEGEGVGFNWFSIGGNTHNYPFPEEDQHEQWYAITDLKIWDGKPDAEDNKRPNPPTAVKAEYR